MSDYYSRKARLAIAGVKAGKAFAYIGASKEAKRKYDRNQRALIEGIKRADRERSRKT